MCWVSSLLVNGVESYKGWSRGNKDSFLRVNIGVGDGIALWKSMLITAKSEIGGAAPQIELRGVADKK